MARRKSKKDNGLGGLAVLLAIPVAIYNFFKENVWLAILIGIVVVAVVVGVIVAKKKKRAAYLRCFYDRDRRIAELNADTFMDIALTDAIMQAAANGSTVAIGREDAALNSVKDAYKLVLQSSDILQSDAALSAQNTGRALIAANGIEPKSDPMILRYVGENNGGYVFYVFPDTILAFVEGPEQVVFIAAYNPAALFLSCGTLRYTLRPQVIPDKTQNPIRYYDRYCPVRDAQIISSRWEVTNKDGSRSLRGGLLPENNPLHFTLKYGKLTVKLGDYSVDTSFSRYDPTMLLTVAHNKFKDGTGAETTKTEPVKAQSTPAKPAPATPKTEKQELVERMTSAINKKAQDNVFTSVTTQQEAEKAAMPSVFVTTNTSLEEEDDTNVIAAVEATATAEDKKTVQPEIIPSVPPTAKKPISIDDARYRNRMIANKIVQELNQAYKGQYDFKVYQVRKPRSDWAMQDAGIYTYIKGDAGNEYTIELNIRTDVENVKTELEFYVWSKQADLVKVRYAELIAVHNMKLKSTGYHFVGQTDYESESQITMENALRNDVTALFAELVAQ